MIQCSIEPKSHFNTDLFVRFASSSDLATAYFPLWLNYALHSMAKRKHGRAFWLDRGSVIKSDYVDVYRGHCVAPRLFEVSHLFWNAPLDEPGTLLPRERTLWIEPPHPSIILHFGAQSESQCSTPENQRQSNCPAAAGSSWRLVDIFN